MWTITRPTDGPDTCDGGARAVAMSLAVAWQTSLPLWPWKVPGVPRVLEALYRWVARNRHRLP